jgi:hypothetical protein
VGKLSLAWGKKESEGTLKLERFFSICGVGDALGVKGSICLVALSTFIA